MLVSYNTATLTATAVVCFTKAGKPAVSWWYNGGCETEMSIVLTHHLNPG